MFNFEQKVWDKMRCSWEHLGEHIENLRNTWKTSLGLARVYLVTHWELGDS